MALEHVRIVHEVMYVDHEGRQGEGGHGQLQDAPEAQQVAPAAVLEAEHTGDDQVTTDDRHQHLK